MWSREKIEKAATRHADIITANNDYNGDEYCYLDVKHAFLAGCKYIINNTQKETEK